MSSKTMCFTVKNKHEIVREPIMIAGQGLRQAFGIGTRSDNDVLPKSY